ncbi:MAG: hypothetical protein ACK5NK_12710 [Niabella sp.]
MYKNFTSQKRAVVGVCLLFFLLLQRFFSGDILIDAFFIVIGVTYFSTAIFILGFKWKTNNRNKQWIFLEQFTDKIFWFDFITVYLGVKMLNWLIEQNIEPFSLWLMLVFLLATYSSLRIYAYLKTYFDITKQYKTKYPNLFI